MSPQLPLAMALGVVILWLLAGVAGELRDRLAKRVVDWLLPDSQPWTFRLAFVIARLSRGIAPIRFYTPATLLKLSSTADLYHAFLSGSPYAFGFSPLVVFALVSPVEVEDPGRWHDPEAASAELEADLNAGRRVLDPVGLVWPVLESAVGSRLLQIGAVLLTPIRALLVLPLVLVLCLVLASAYVVLAFQGRTLAPWRM